MKQIVNNNNYESNNFSKSEWLNYKEAAQYLRLTEGALRTMVYREEISAYRIGKRRIRFRLNDLRNIIQKVN